MFYGYGTSITPELPATSGWRWLPAFPRDVLYISAERNQLKPVSSTPGGVSLRRSRVYPGPSGLLR